MKLRIVSVHESVDEICPQDEFVRRARALSQGKADQDLFASALKRPDLDSIPKTVKVDGRDVEIKNIAFVDAHFDGWDANDPQNIRFLYHGGDKLYENRPWGLESCDSSWVVVTGLES